MPPQSPAWGLVSGLLLVAPPIVASLYDVKLTGSLGGAIGLEGASLVLHVQRGVLQLEGRARGEDQGRVERHRGAAVGHAAVVAGGSLKHEGRLA